MLAAEGDVPLTCADISKARRLSGYEPRTPIAQGIAEFVEWYRGAHRPDG
jgi:UDP-glucuronate 4-epimerase